MKKSQFTVQDTGEVQLDLMLIGRIFVSNLWKILIVGILAAGLLGTFRYLTAYVTYTSNVKFLISGLTLTKIDDQYTYISSSSGGSGSGSQFAVNAPDIIQGSKTLGLVKEHLEANNTDSPYHDQYIQMKAADLGRMVNVAFDQQIVILSVTHRDPALAMEVAEAFRCIVPNQMSYYYGIESAYNNVTDTPAETDSVESETAASDAYENVKSVAKALNTVSEEYLIREGRGELLYAAIGFFLGSVAMFGICFLRSFFDKTVYCEDDLKNAFTLPVIGQIPAWDSTTDGVSASADTATDDKRHTGAGKNTAKDKTHAKKNGKSSAHSKTRTRYGHTVSKQLRRKPSAKRKRLRETGGPSERDYSGRLLSDRTPFAITEAFKSLRTNMCYTTKGEKCAVYGVTSAYIQAGKSLVIANLAISFSMMNKKVLLLDADLRCPAQHKVFNITNRVHGLSDVLAGICRYEDMELRDGGYPNLSILTSGKLPPNPAELLASENMKRFLERARRDYDFIFIDLPPVSEVSDAGILSELVTGFTFVVRSAHSDRRMVELALEAMEGFQAPLTGFILNDIDIKLGTYYKNKYDMYSSKYSKFGRNERYGVYSEYSLAYQSNQPKS